MAVIVDASAIAAMAFGEPERAMLIDHLAGETLIAPTLLDYELANIAVTKARRHPGAVAAILAGLHVALTLPMTRYPVPAGDVAALATETGLTAYDATYLWLARSRDAELVTLDHALVRLTNEYANPHT